MKFTLGWLKEHLDTTATLPDITDRLTAIGLEVEGIRDEAARFAPFKVARVISAEKHPDADRLRVCRVETTEGEVQVVCGAPNARTGMKAVFAPAGSLIPGTGDKLKKGVIRGQESNGMLVSEKEMGLSDNHEGIIEVPEGVPVGTPFAVLYGRDDPQIEINLTPNRGDCAAIRGIARDLAAAGLGTLKPLLMVPIPGAFPCPIGVDLRFDEQTKDACPLFAGRLIRGVKNGPSPDWLQQRLKSVGMKPISALVDLTNFMTMDLGRPLHVFDADKLAGNLHVRLSKAGETLAALNEKEYTLADGMTVVCDDSGVLALGGVMGGAATGCSDETTNVFIESACFDPLRIARTGRALQIDSDARYRFERGVDPDFTIPGLDVVTRLVLELCGGTPSEGVVAGAVPEARRILSYRPDRVRGLTGTHIPLLRQREILARLGFDVEETGNDHWNVTAPSSRPDVEGEADLVEEIVRIEGYVAIVPVSVLAPDPVGRPAETVGGVARRRGRQALALRGFRECVTWSFMPQAMAEKFGANDSGAADHLRLKNPISTEMDQMRPSILPNLLLAAQRNADRGFGNAALFEVGPAFATQKPDGQKNMAAGVRHLARGDRHWSGSEASRAVDAFDAKGDALAVLEACGAPVERLQITRDAPAWYHPGRSGALRLGAVPLAYFGELHPGVLADLDVKGPAAGFEVFLDALPPVKKKGTARPALAASPFQPLRRDFAFVLDAGVEADALVRLIRGTDKTLIADVQIFDVYQGKGMEDGKKSIAVSVTLQPRSETLTDKAIEAVCAAITDAVQAKLGGTIRG